MKHRSSVACAAALAAVVAAAAPPGVVAIRNARVVTASGPALDRATVVIRDGLIESVGAEVSPPADAWVIEGDGLTVYPGLIDALSSWGIPEAQRTPPAPPSRAPAAPADEPQSPVRPQGPQDRPATTSWLRAADLISPSDRRLQAARSAGFTSAVVFPQRGIFAGQGAVVNLHGDRPSDMVVATPVGQYVTLTTGGFSSFPGSLMGVIAYIRQVYLDADYSVLVRQDYQGSPLGKKRVPYDRALEGLLESPRILLPAVRQREVDRMLRLAAELRREAVLYGLHEGYRCVERLKQANASVLVNVRWPEAPGEADPDTLDSLRTLELRDRAPGTPAALAKAGVRFALYSGSIEQPRDILRALKRALDAGLDEEAAVRALTLSAAEIFGVADRMGSLEKGKIANLIVVRGKLFDERSELRHVFIDGVKIDPAPPRRPEGARAESGLEVQP